MMWCVKNLLTGVLFFLSFMHAALAGRISGTVTDDKGNILAYASVYVKGTRTGTTSNNHGNYFLDLSPGNYSIVCQYVGYARQEKNITVTADAATLNFQLALQQTSMKEVVVKAGGEDPAYDIIRHAIKKRKSYENPLDSFTCEVYIKALVKSRSLPAKMMGKTLKDEDRKEMGVDSEGRGILYLSESLTKISFQKPEKIKLEVISGRESGSNGYGFNFPTFINFYSNNVSVFIPRFNPRGYVSPIADGALNYYKYKYLGSFFEDGKEINQIRVTPKRKYEPLFTGTINITEGDWRIHSLDLMLVKESQLELLDTLTIKQIHTPVTKEVWRTQNQVTHFAFKKIGIDVEGNFLNVYNNYDLGPAFKKKYFNNVVVKYDTSVNKKSIAYWDSLRPVPLEPEEIANYLQKDSLYRAEHDSSYLRKLNDSLRRNQGKITVTKLLFTGYSRSDYDPWRPHSFTVTPLLTGVSYNTVEGVVMNAEVKWRAENIAKGSSIEFIPHLRYGFSNTHLNAWGTINLSKHNFVYDLDGGSASRSAWSFSGGKRVSQFNPENPISPAINALYTLFFRDNYMKLYENYFGNIKYAQRWDNGLRFGASALYEDRMPLDNTSNYSLFGSRSKLFTPNYPFEKLNAPFPRHQAVILEADIQFKPGQRYIEFPDRKLAIGSKYPTLALSYIKGINGVLGSDVDYDKWKFSVWDNVNLKLRGLFKYRFDIGGFFNSKKVFIQDYQHFNGNQTFFASEYLNSFELAPYYANSTIASFYAVGHIEHHFNGLLTNKIPLLKSLNWNLVAGSNAFYVNRSNNYVEVFGGLENIFKVLRVDVVVSYLNGKTGQAGVRLGIDGLFGGLLKAAINNPGGGGSSGGRPSGPGGR